MKKIFLFTMIIFASVTSFSQNNYLLQGNIGKRSVTMNIRQEDDTIIYARYFYSNNLQDIFLEG